MRDLTKSVFSFSWAMSLFGFQQTLNLTKPSKASQAFDNVTEATNEEIGDTLKAVFRAGDNLQRGLVDVTLGLFAGQAFNPSRLVKMTSDVMNQSAEAVGQGIRAATSSAQAASGWSPVPNSAQGQPQARRAGPAPGASAGPAPAASQGWGPMPS